MASPHVMAIEAIYISYQTSFRRKLSSADGLSAFNTLARTAGIDTRDRPAVLNWLSDNLKAGNYSAVGAIVPPAAPAAPAAAPLPTPAPAAKSRKARIVSEEIRKKMGRPVKEKTKQVRVPESLIPAVLAMIATRLNDTITNGSDKT